MKHKKYTLRKQPLAIVISVLALIVLIGLYSWYSTTVGQAISIDGTTWQGGTIDLREEGSITLTRVPEQSFSIDLAATTAYQEENPATYSFVFLKQDAATYQVMLLRGDDLTLIAGDTFSTRLPEDSSLVYLPGPANINDYDAIPDLKITLKNGKFTITNLHYLGFASTQIKLVHNGTYAPYPAVIALQPGETFTAVINATAQFIPPDIAANYSGTLLKIQNLDQNPIHDQQNFTNGTITFTAPSESAAITLDLIATVQNQRTHQYYTLAVGNVAYALPATVLAPQFKIQIQDERHAALTTSFVPTAELQPFAIPCDVSGNFNTLLANSRIQKIYTYDAVNRQPLVWTKSAPSDFMAFESLHKFRGYFVQLGETGEVSLNIPCTLKNLQSLGPVPALGAEYTRLAAGWNLIALPGVVPRPLTDFTADRDFTLYDCQERTCRETPSASFLLPGRAYWMYSSSPITLYYKLE